MDPSFFNKALLKKANHGSYARVFGSRILSKLFGSCKFLVLLWRRVPHQQSRRLTVKRTNMLSVEASLPKRWWFCQAHGRVNLSPTRAKTNDFAVWILKWVAFDCKRRMALFFELCIFTAACNSQFGCQKADMKFWGRDITVLKVKPLRVMPKGLRTTWPLSIALPEIWPNPFNWAIFDAMQREAAARVVSRACFFEVCLTCASISTAQPCGKPLEFAPKRWLIGNETNLHLPRLSWLPRPHRRSLLGALFCVWMLILTENASCGQSMVVKVSLVAIHYLVMTAHLDVFRWLFQNSPDSCAVGFRGELHGLCVL